MADEAKTTSSGTALNTAKIAGIVAFLPTVLTSLPEWASLSICTVMITCAAITASVPAPSKSRVLIALYQVVRVIGLNVGSALPYVAAHLVKGASSDASTPLAAPGSVVTIPKETAK